jgi:hypothetical protein
MARNQDDWRLGNRFNSVVPQNELKIHRDLVGEHITIFFSTGEMERRSKFMLKFRGSKNLKHAQKLHDEANHSGVDVCLSALS